MSQILLIKFLDCECSDLVYAGNGHVKYILMQHMLLLTIEAKGQRQQESIDSTRNLVFNIPGEQEVLIKGNSFNIVAINK